jgi:hypothetical protein
MLASSPFKIWLCGSLVVLLGRFHWFLLSKLGLLNMNLIASFINQFLIPQKLIDWWHDFYTWTIVTPFQLIMLFLNLPDFTSLITNSTSNFRARS